MIRFRALRNQLKGFLSRQVYFRHQILFQKKTQQQQSTTMMTAPPPNNTTTRTATTCTTTGTLPRLGGTAAGFDVAAETITNVYMGYRTVAYGHVNNACIPEAFEAGRWHHMGFHRLKGRLNRAGLSLVIASSDVQFLQEMKGGRSVVCRTLLKGTTTAMPPTTASSSCSSSPSASASASENRGCSNNSSSSSTATTVVVNHSRPRSQLCYLHQLESRDGKALLATAIMRVAFINMHHNHGSSYDSSRNPSGSGGGPVDVFEALRRLDVSEEEIQEIFAPSSSFSPPATTSTPTSTILPDGKVGDDEAAVRETTTAARGEEEKEEATKTSFHKKSSSTLKKTFSTTLLAGSNAQSAAFRSAQKRAHRLNK